MISMLAAVKCINRVPNQKLALRCSHMKEEGILEMNERRDGFLEYLKVNKTASTKDLEVYLNTGEMVVRGDAAALIDLGKIRKTKNRSGKVLFRLQF